MSLAGFVLPVATLGLGSLLLRPRRGFLPAGGSLIIPQATLEEEHRDSLEITSHPIEQGASISDHAFKRPAEVTITAGWSNSPTPQGGLISAAIAGALPFARVPRAASTGALIATGVQAFLSGSAEGQIKAIYEQLLRLQSSLVPFDIYTGKRAYKDMMFEMLTTKTDAESANNLIIVAHCRQVIIVTTTLVQVLVNVSAQSFPEDTTPTEKVGDQQLEEDTQFVEPEADTEEVVQ